MTEEVKKEEDSGDGVTFHDESEAAVPEAATPQSIRIKEEVHVRAPPIEAVKDLIAQFRKELEEEEPYKTADADVREYCSDVTLHRYLRARGKNVSKAKKMLVNTIEWRKKMQPQRILAKTVEVEATTGKIYSPGLDRHGRPILVLNSTKENTNDFENQMRHLAFNLERTTRLMKNGIEKYAVFIHLEEFSFWNAPPFKTSRETINQVTNYFPEHLGTCVMWQAPMVFSGFYKALSPFIDAQTKSKIFFLSGDSKDGSNNDQLMKDLIGDNWKVLVGVDQKVHAKGCSPGYVHAEQWARVLEQEKEWLASREAKEGKDGKDAKDNKDSQEAKDGKEESKDAVAKEGAKEASVAADGASAAAAAGAASSSDSPATAAAYR